VTQKAALFDARLINGNHTRETGEPDSARGEEHPGEDLAQTLRAIPDSNLAQEEGTSYDGDPNRPAVVPGGTKDFLRATGARVDSVEKLARGKIQSASDEEIRVL